LRIYLKGLPARPEGLVFLSQKTVTKLEASTIQTISGSLQRSRVAENHVRASHLSSSTEPSLAYPGITPVYRWGSILLISSFLTEQAHIYKAWQLLN